MIRNANANDTEQIMEIWLAGNQSAHAFIPSCHWQKHYQATKEALQQTGIAVWVYEDEQGIQGFIGINGTYIEGIFVKQAARGRGIGKLLLERVKSTHRMLTLHVYQKNIGAYRFYLREGFRAQRTGTDFETGEHDIEMGWMQQTKA